MADGWWKSLVNTQQNNLQPLKRVLLVECARGAAAIYICLGHITKIGRMAESFRWGKFAFYPLGFGQEAVFLFFFLSGFSVHYSSVNRPLGTIGGVGTYYYLRFRRIYPIFLFAVGMSVALGAATSWLGIISKTPCHLNARDVFFVLLMLSDIHTGSWHAGLANNPALWFLSYLIPYYLVYPFFWHCCKRFGAERAFLVTLFASGAFIVADCLHSNHVSNVFSLYWLWTSGAMMAEWKLTSKNFILSPIGYHLVLFVCYAVSQSLEAIASPVILWNLQAATIGIVMFSAFIGFKPIRPSNGVLAGCGILILLVASCFVTRDLPTWGRHIFLDARLVFAAGVVTFLMFTGTNVSSFCRTVLKPFLKAGSISYPLYVIHMPILYFLADLLRHSSTSSYCMPLALLPIIFLAWGLGIRFQGRVSHWLDVIWERAAATSRQR
jgi:peptidoglycan/LPS O-acetylase OafA/YrhL